MCVWRMHGPKQGANSRRIKRSACLHVRGSAAGCSVYRDAIPDEHRRLLQVHNVADTLSVNHNWINACNVHWTYQLLRRDLADATAAIEGAPTRVMS
jgi:hypothetical protein